MPRYRLTIAYEGTNFCGWQRQEPPAPAVPTPIDVADQPPVSEAHAVIADAPKPPPTRAAFAPDTPLIESTRAGRVALRTVQGVVEQAVRSVVREPVEVLGASRTDSGVHAKGQVAAFTCEPRAASEGESATKGTGWPAARGTDRLMAAINSRLPDDVLVIDAARAHNNFDPISDATSKAYSYTFHCGQTRPLWDRTRVHHLWHPTGLDVDAMNAAAAHLVGEHDFAAFAAAGHGRLSTVRRIFTCSITRERAERVRLDITGSGFLWNMVRIIAGTLMQVGTGQRTPEQVAMALESRDRTQAGPTLPPTGLCLEWIRYARDSTADSAPVQ